MLTHDLHVILFLLYQICFLLQFYPKEEEGYCFPSFVCCWTEKNRNLFFQSFKGNLLVYRYILWLTCELEITQRKLYNKPFYLTFTVYPLKDMLSSDLKADSFDDEAFETGII